MKKITLISSLVAISVVAGLASAKPIEARGNNAYYQYLQQMQAQAQIQRAQQAAQVDAYNQAKWDYDHNPNNFVGIPGKVVDVHSPEAQAYFGSTANAISVSQGNRTGAFSNSYGYGSRCNSVQYNPWNNTWNNGWNNN